MDAVFSCLQSHVLRSTLHHMQRNLERVANEVNRLVEESRGVVSHPCFFAALPGSCVCKDQDAVRDICEARVAPCLMGVTAER